MKKSINMSYNEEMKKFNQNIPDSSDKRDCSTREHCVDYEMRWHVTDL